MSETALQLHKPQQEPAVVLTRDDIRKYICPNADDKEIFMFLGICKSFGLNPMKREVHLIKYGNAPASIVTGYEVYLKRAERTGKVDGFKVWTNEQGTKAFCTINRKDRKLPFEWEVDRKEFDKGQANWKSMPNFMLKKVCMAQAFRLCFPDEMGGLPYLPEEIGPNASEALPAHEPIIETVEAKAADPAPPPAVEKQPPPPPAAPTEEKKDIQTLMSDLQQLAEIAVDAGKYPSIRDAIYAWTSYKDKKTNATKGFFAVTSLKQEWQLTGAITRANDELNAIPPAPVDEGEDDIPM